MPETSLGKRPCSECDTSTHPSSFSSSAHQQQLMSSAYGASASPFPPSCPVLYCSLCSSLRPMQATKRRCRDVIRNACDVGSDAQSLKDFEDEQLASGMAAELQSHARKPVTLHIPGRHSMRITLLPPVSPDQRRSVHALADIAKAADVVLLCMAHPQESTNKRSKPLGALDAEGTLALQVLRSMGLPQVLVAVQGVGASMKARAHAKKLAAAALEAELSGDLKACLHLCSSFHNNNNGAHCKYTTASTPCSPQACRSGRLSVLLPGVMHFACMPLPLCARPCSQARSMCTAFSASPARDVHMHGRSHACRNQSRCCAACAYAKPSPCTIHTFAYAAASRTLQLRSGSPAKPHSTQERPRL